MTNLETKKPMLKLMSTWALCYVKIKFLHILFHYKNNFSLHFLQETDQRASSHFDKLFDEKK